MFRVKDQNGYIKYSGRSRGIVVDNRDPLNKGRILVDHPIVGPTTWIEYLRTPGHFTVPSINDVVYVECDAGHTTHPIAWGNLTTGANNSPNIPEAFRRDIPTNRGMFTPGGHLLELDDGIAPLSGNITDTNFTTENRGIRLTTTAGNKIHIAEDTDNSQQYILLEDVNGNSFRLNYQDNTVNITSTGQVNIEGSGGARARYTEGTVAFGTSSVELLQQFSDTLQSLITLTNSMSTETHLANLGYPTAVPDNAADYISANSELTNLKSLVDSIRGSL